MNLPHIYYFIALFIVVSIFCECKQCAARPSCCSSGSWLIHVKVDVFKTYDTAFNEIFFGCLTIIQWNSGIPHSNESFFFQPFLLLSSALTSKCLQNVAKILRLFWIFRLFFIQLNEIGTVFFRYHLLFFPLINGNNEWRTETAATNHKKTVGVQYIYRHESINFNLINFFVRKLI